MGFSCRPLGLIYLLLLGVTPLVRLSFQFCLRLIGRATAVGVEALASDVRAEGIRLIGEGHLACREINGTKLNDSD